MGCWLSGPWMGDQMINGRSLKHLSQRDALRILAASQLPVTMQVKTQRGCGSEAERGGWEPLPLDLRHLNLPLPMMGPGLNLPSPSYQDRHYYAHLALPKDHCDGGHYGYLSGSQRDTVDIGQQDPEMTNRRPKGQSCLMGCCNVNGDEPQGFHSQTDDDDFMLEKPLGYLPIHHELDSGLGWTDGSLHQGDLSGLETEEGGLEECHSHGAVAPGGCGGFGGGSPSSESFISSELSDSGFYSVSTGEFRHFQRLLEKRMRLYNARLQHQGEPCERRERRDSCPKSHRELLEAIPETLTMQPQCPRLQLGMDEGVSPVIDCPPRGLFRVSSVQFHKADRPCLNRHSSSSGALFNPSHAHTAVSRMTAPVLSTCSTPSSHRRPLVPMQQHHQSSGSVGMLRRSRTLHHRPPPHENRRRASHPASPSYCSATLHHCGGLTPHSLLQPGLPEERELLNDVMSNPAALNVPSQQHPNNLGLMRNAISQERFFDSSPSGQLGQHDWWHSQQMNLVPEHLVQEREIERELEQQRQMQTEKEMEREAQMQVEMERERQQELDRKIVRDKQHLQSLMDLPQQGDVNDTWPKPASRQSQVCGTGKGPYSTLEGHIGTGANAGLDVKKGQMNPNPISSMQPKPNPNSKPNPSFRVSRSQLLRDRASQLADERSGGMSTDEETNTDLLMGRYWSRTERREHFLLAREQRQQQARGGSIREANRAGGVTTRASGCDKENRDTRVGSSFQDSRCNTVLELSQRKLSRLRNRKMLDDWTTVEELLTHGTRLDSHENLLCPSSLLTVTTV